MGEPKKQWRICGSRPNHGQWEGVWRDRYPDANERRQLVARNDDVRIECRTVIVSEPVVVWPTATAENQERSSK